MVIIISLFNKGCYLTPFIFSLIKDIESNNSKKKIGHKFITNKVCQPPPPPSKKEKNRKKEKMNLGKKGELVALDRRIRWAKFH